MATKKENIIRLQQLAGILGRQADITGTAADIERRVAEWEEEVGLEEGDEGGVQGEEQHSGNHTEGVQEEKSIRPEEEDGLVLVTLLVSVHLSGAYDASGEVKIDTGIAGQQVRIPEGMVDAFRHDKIIA